MANFRDITKVEEITTFSETDKLIVNSNGTAKQIDINLIAGGVPDGGTTGQVLTKTSSVDGEAIWKDLPEVEVPQEVVFVNVTMASMTEGTADKTFAELTEAYNRGAAIFARLIAEGEVVLPLIQYISTDLAGDDAQFVFCASIRMFNAELVANIYTDSYVEINSTRISEVAANVSDAAGETVTAAEFNALLSALRDAGLMEQPAVPE